MAGIAQTDVSNPLVVQEVKDFVSNNTLGRTFTQINPTIGSNVNGYPFVTFIDSNNEAENIYFSKDASKLVAKDQEIVKGFFDEFVIAETTNAIGEKRIKICKRGDGVRKELADIF